MTTRTLTTLLPAAAALAAATALAQPLTTGFTYQGELRSAGVPASGLHDLRFRLYDAAVQGSQVGPALCSDNVSLANGRFTVDLDFGAVFAGQQRFLEIDVRADTGLGCGNAAGFTTLAPRQPLTAAPNAAFALNAATAASATTAATASNATLFNGQSASFYQNASNLASGMVPGGLLGGTYPGMLTFSNTGNAFTGAFSGSGAGLTGLNASSIASGTLADARLTANVALLHTNQTFTGGKAFSVAPAFTAGGTPFTVTNTTLVSNLNADLLDGLHASAFLQEVPNPLTLSGSAAGSHIIRGNNSSISGQSVGVFGHASGTGGGLGLQGQQRNGAGVVPTNGAGVFGTSDTRNGVAGFSGTGDAMWALALGTTGPTNGLTAESRSTSGTGVRALASAGSGTTYGLWGQSDSPEGYGVYGLATDSTGWNFGGWFESAGVNGRGVSGRVTSPTGSTLGGAFESYSTSGYGVWARAAATSGTTYGGWFQALSPSGRAVYGWASAASGANEGGHFESGSTSGVGVVGMATANSGSAFGGQFESTSTSGRGVYGSASAASGSTFGGYFESASTGGYGVYARASATSGTVYGVRGYASTAAGGYAVYAAGDMGASGVKPFRIDHPADPENKYLLHYAAESPEVINFYRGSAALDGSGEAVVELPAYFASINTNPTYQLTAVGAPMPMLHVAEKVSSEALRAGERTAPGEPIPVCSFRIAGGVPGGEVSWEVKAVRHDLRMRLHGAPVEREKAAPERGKYQHPEYYGQPPERGMDHHARAEIADSKESNR